MIYNGNYKYDLVKNIYKVVCESFIEFYGKIYTDEIKQTFSTTKIVSYHTKDAIVEYYSNYITKFRDKILERFYKRCNIDRDEKLDDILFGKNIPIDETKLNIACEGGEDFSKNDSYTKEYKEKIKKYRIEITKYLGLSLDKKENYKQLMSLRNLFLECVKEIENENNCDVFDDIRTIDKNTKTNLQDFFERVDDYLYMFARDKEKVNSEKFDANYLDLLDSNNILFNNYFEDSGLLTAFTEESNDIIKNGSQKERMEIIIKRLMYLNYIGIDTNFDIDTLKDYLEKNEIATDDNNIWTYQIYKEYNYQKSRQIENKYIKNISQKEFEKSWKKGNFIPSDIAEDLEDYRKYYSNAIIENTKFRKGENSEDLTNYIVKNFKNRYIFSPTNKIFLCEDDATNSIETFLINLIHEMNHAVSEEKPYKISENKVTTKNSLSYSGYSHKDLEITNILATSETRELEEFVNQMQTIEIYKILKRKMKENNIKIETDGITKKSIKRSLYEYYTILGRDFYLKFREQLKLQNVDPSYRLYFDFDLPYNKTQLVTNRVKDKVDRIFNRAYSQDGCLDFYKAEKLSKLITKLYKEILPEVLYKKISIRDFLAGNIDKLSDGAKIKLAKLIEKKDKIMNEIYKDEKRYKSL